jgi:glycosyltransferase involved in cell wall biosynthesis
MTFALHFEPSAYTLAGKIMGRQAAGASFLRAIAKAQLPVVHALAPDLEQARTLANELARLGAPRTGVRHVSSLNPSGLAEARVLFRPDPGIVQDAWIRRAHASASAWSICGITHTISSHAPMQAIADLLTAPVQPWDALICTSTVARTAVRYVLDQQSDYLRSRFGAIRVSQPQLPIIPLGIHVDDFAVNEADRSQARARLGVETNEIVVLFAGRLIPHGKAHPVPMYRALQEAADGHQVVLIQAGVTPTEAMAHLYREEPRRLCPSVRTITVNGRDSTAYRQAWAAADIFTSLSDNLQETQGLTPLEAMAAGLPAVVTDWNGYRDAIRHGVDGFRIPTLAPGPGQAEHLSDRYDRGIDNFDYFSGYTSQFVAADVRSAAEAYRSLIAGPALRKRMGEAGKERARRVYDWSVILPQYFSLWEELHRLRPSMKEADGKQLRQRPPHRPDTFAMFAAHPTATVNASTRFAARTAQGVQMADQLRRFGSISFAEAMLPSRELIQTILLEWPIDEIRTFGQLAELHREIDEAEIARAILWLTKIGVLGTDLAIDVDEPNPAIS